jgi:hypothetical protein
VAHVEGKQLLVKLVFAAKQLGGLRSVPDDEEQCVALLSLED